jgi:hypothetical protein
VLESGSPMADGRAGDASLPLRRRRSAPHAASRMAAVVFAAGYIFPACIPLEDAGDPVSAARSDAARAEAAEGVRRRYDAWYLVKCWTVPGLPSRDLLEPDLTAGRPSPDAQLPEGVSEAASRLGMNVRRASPPTGEPTAVVMIREGQPGYLIINRKIAVFRMPVRPKVYTGESPVAGGFEVYACREAGSGVRLRLTPVFMGLDDDGGDLTAGDLALEVVLPRGRAIELSASDGAGEVVKTLLFRGYGEARARRAKGEADVPEAEPVRVIVAAEWFR